MSRPRARPTIHFAYAGDWYDGPLDGLIRVDGRPGLLWFEMVSESPRGRRTYAAFETPPEFVTIVRAERKLDQQVREGAMRWRATPPRTSLPATTPTPQSRPRPLPISQPGWPSANEVAGAAAPTEGLWYLEAFWHCVPA